MALVSQRDSERKCRLCSRWEILQDVVATYNCRTLAGNLKVLLISWPSLHEKAESEVFTEGETRLYSLVGNRHRRRGRIAADDGASSDRLGGKTKMDSSCKDAIGRNNFRQGLTNDR